MPDGKPEDRTTEAARELAELYPAARSFTVAGRVVEIKPCTLSQAGAIVTWEAAFAAEKRSLFAVMEELPDMAADYLAAMTGGDRAWIVSLAPVDRLRLHNCWRQVNAGFFRDRLFPEIIAALLPADGDGRT